MSYEPTFWKDGDTVTSAKLNKIEQGIASSSNGVVMAHVNGGPPILDMTWQEIWDNNCTTICIISSGDNQIKQFISINSIGYSPQYGDYRIGAILDNEKVIFSAPTVNDYPTYTKSQEGGNQE